MSRDRTVQVPGGSLSYRTQGQGPPLMLIGGGPSNADTLRRLAAELGVPLAELPGHHAGMIQYPAEFASALGELLPPVR